MPALICDAGFPALFLASRVCHLPGSNYQEGLTAIGARTGTDMMSNGSSPSLSELDARIAILRDNIRQLIEQAAGYSGAEDEERNADQIAQQTEELETLTKQRDALLKK